MLELVLSKSSYIKTKYIRNQILNEKMGDKVFLLVPDQFSFENERAILNEGGAKFAAGIKILTFSRLAEEIFRVYGGISETRLDDMGKIILMSNAITACSDNLELLNSGTKEDRLTALMIKFVEEMKTSFISPQDILDSARDLDGVLAQKTYEVGLIYQTYEELIKHAYIDPDDIITRLSHVLNEHKYFEGATVYIDGFEYFNRQKRAVLSSVIRNSKKVICALACDDVSNDEEDVFSVSQKTGLELIKIARQEGIKVLSPIKLSMENSDKSTVLKHLEENLFTKEEVCEENEGIELFEAKDIYEECEYTAATIRELIISGKYRYGDIAVLVRNSDAFTNIMDTAFKKWEIPVYMAKPKKFRAQALVSLLMSAFDALLANFESSKILKMLKTGLCPLSLENVSELENYVFMWNINGKEWKSEFVKSPSGFDTGNKERDDERLIEIEKSRQVMITPLLKLEKGLKNEDCFEKCSAIFQFLSDLEVEAKVKEKRSQFLLRGMEEEAQELVRTWARLIKILDNFVTTMQGQSVSFSRFISLFKQLANEEEFLEIPLKLDTVNFANASQVKIDQVKVAFVLGAVQGEFPLNVEDAGIFTDFERKELIYANLMLENDTNLQSLLEKYVAFTATTSACEKLYLSWHLSRGSDSFAPSSLIHSIREIFVKLRVKSKVDEMYYVNSKPSLMSAASKNYRKNDARSKAYVKLIMDDKEYAQKLLSIDFVSNKKAFSINDHLLSKKMFFENNFSASQIEVYHKCKFGYFCKYGLGARERKTAQISALEYGNIMHYLFEKMLVGDYENCENDSKLQQKIEEYIKKYIEEYMGGMKNLSTVDAYRISRIAYTAFTIIKRVMEELSQSKFKPKYTELKLNKNSDYPPLEIVSENGNKAYVSGVIDRVDVYENDGVSYVRIIDYKTGSKEFKLSDILVGMNLQMLLYLAAICQNENLRPAGMLYLPAVSPQISGKKGESVEKYISELDKKLCMKGLVLNESEIIHAMEEQAKGRFIPVSYSDKNKLKSEENTFKIKDMENVFSHVKTLVASMADSLLEGKIEASPLLVGTDSCKWCPYESVCGAKSSENEEQKITMKNSEVLKILGKEDDENG